MRRILLTDWNTFIMTNKTKSNLNKPIENSCRGFIIETYQAKGREFKQQSPVEREKNATVNKEL